MKKNEYLPLSNYRIINGETLSKNGIDWSKAGYISEERYKESPEIMLKKDDILISKDGTIGKIGFVDNLDIPTTVSSGIFVIRNERPNEIDTKFIYHFLRSPYFKTFIEMRTEGSVIPHLYQKDFVDMDFPLFDIINQRKIAKILNFFDEKITLNNNINNNLEQQIQSLFSKMFPSIFSNSNGTVGDLISFSNGKKRPNIEGKIPVYGGNGILAYTNKPNNKNCIIIGRVGAYCGNVYYSSQPCWISDNAISAQSIKGDSQLFSYYLLKNAALPSRYIGTSQPLLTQGILTAIPCNIPNEDEINAFNNTCMPLQAMVDTNTTENVQLALLRESILPKLMSGELDISNDL